MISQPPTRMSAIGQKKVKIFEIIPCACRRRRTPNKMSAPPQKILSRLILATLPSASEKSAHKYVEPQPDQYDGRAIFSQKIEAAQEGSHTHKAGNESPHVRPGAEVICSVLIKKNSANACNNGSRDCHARCAC